MKQATEVLDSFESNIYCMHTFTRGLRDFAILKPILEEREKEALISLLAETDYANPDIDTEVRKFRCQEISIVVKYLKQKYRDRKVSTDNIPKNYEDYWHGHHSFKDALMFVSDCQRRL